MHFIAFDTETTGTDPRKDRIIELYAQEVTWPLLFPLREISVLVNPGIPIPAEASAIHGVTDRDVAAAPLFGEVAPAVQDLMTDAVLIAYNGRRFDVPLLHHELVRAGCKGLPVDQVVIDPYETFVKDFPRSLTGALRHYAGELHVDAHGAQADVAAMIKVLGVQLLHHPAPDLLEAAKRPDRMPLDHFGCFYRDLGGIARFGFGKHKDKPVASQPDYLRWMRGADFALEVRDLAARFLGLGCKPPFRPDRPSP